MGRSAPHPLGQATDQRIVGHTARLRRSGPWDSGLSGAVRESLVSAIPRALSGHTYIRAGSHRLPVVVAIAALPQSALHGVHYPVGHPDTRGSPAPLLGPGLHAGNRLVPLSACRPDGPGMDVQGRLGDPTKLAGYSGDSSLGRAGAMVAFLRQLFMDAQWRGFLRDAVCDRSVAAAGADNMGNLPQCALDGDSVLVAAFPGGPELDAL